MFGSKRPRYRFYPEERTAKKRILSVVKFLILAFLVYELIATFLLTSYQVESRAMQPAFAPGDSLFVSPLPFGARLPLFDSRTAGLGEPRRGDLVVARTTYREETGALVRPVQSFVRFFTGQTRGVGGSDWRPDVVLRRIIALPGDTVRMEESIFYVRPPEEDSFLSEFEVSQSRYPLIREDSHENWSELSPFNQTMEEVTLGENEFFLAADNRDEAIDSRYGGAVSRDDLLSRVILRYRPFRRFGVPGQ